MEVCMFDIPAIKQRLIIIKHLSLDDAVILDENYKQLMKDTPNPDERDQLIVLRTRIQRRINDLLKVNN
jgi:hypothetical protein